MAGFGLAKGKARDVQICERLGQFSQRTISACRVARLLGRTPASTVVFALSVLCGTPVRAGDVLATQLEGKTLSAVVYASDAPGPVSGRSLHRMMLQAYLEPDGQALFRQWVGARDRYSAPAAARWSLIGDRLCLALPGGALCAAVHVWGPRIAGIGIQPYAMLDGDLQAGNAITGRGGRPQ